MPCPKSKSPSIRNEPIRDYALPHRPSFRLCSHFPTRQQLNLRRLSSRSSSIGSSALTVSPLQDASSRSNQFTSAPSPLLCSVAIHQPHPSSYGMPRRKTVNHGIAQRQSVPNCLLVLSPIDSHMHTWSTSVSLATVFALRHPPVRVVGSCTLDAESLVVRRNQTLFSQDCI